MYEFYDIPIKTLEGETILLDFIYEWDDNRETVTLLNNNNKSICWYQEQQMLEIGRKVAQDEYMEATDPYRNIKQFPDTH